MPKGGQFFKKASFLGGFFIALFFLAGCDGEQEPARTVFRYNEPVGVPTLDPAFAKDKSTLWAVQQLFDGLVELTPENTIAPGLAKRWTVDSAGMNYTFILREAVFHDGRPVRAEDVVYSFGRLVDPAVASPGSWVMDPVAAVAAEGDTAVRITLKAPFSSFLASLAMPYCSVVPMGAQELATAPVGSGPFKFHRWHVGEKLILHRHEAYWKADAEGVKLPYLDGVSISFFPDQQSAFLEYLSGRFDFLPNLDPSFQDELLTARGELREKYREGHRLVRTPFLNTEYLVFNAEAGLPYDLRWAINAAIDRPTMIAELRNGVGIPATGGLVPFGLPEYDPERGIAYDPDSAAKIFASYDVLPELELVTVANYRDLCEFVQGALSSLGWPISVNVIPSATLRSQKSSGELAFFRASWIADYPDAENYLMLFYSKWKAPAGPNYSRFDHARFDELYEQIATLPAGEERSALMREADALLMEQAALVPLYYDEVLRVFPDRVSGVKTNALNALDLREARMSSPTVGGR